MVEGRTQVNLPDDVMSILEYFGKKLKPAGIPPLKYPDTIRAMAAKLDPKFAK